MIEDKKIEEAARGAADLYEQDLPIMSYDEDTEVDGQHHFCQEFGAELFKDGVKWAINEFLKDLWHDVDEMPKRAKAFIFECGDYSMNYHVGMMFNPNDYKKNAEIWHMNRWCYLEDILPKQEGGEQ